VITGPTGVGKSRLACALGHKACRDNRSVLYVRVPKLFDDLALAHGAAGMYRAALGDFLSTVRQIADILGVRRIGDLGHLIPDPQ
jgi:DNA replication protein DnaC